ncbi:MAG: hypothetical protein KDA80_24260, partial [Planctomycetaceae bacterium]|nr:hypothetical protein [Planctomycetaceae bacterium]
MPRPSTLLTTLYGLALSSWAGMLLAQDTQRADWQTHGQPASGDILLIDEHFRTVRLETPSSGDWESTTKTPGPLLLPPLPESAAPISPSKAEAEPLQTSASPVPAPMLLPPLPQEARMTPRPISEPIPPSKRRPTPQSLPAPEPLSPIQQVA